MGLHVAALPFVVSAVFAGSAGYAVGKGDVFAGIVMLTIALVAGVAFFCLQMQDGDR